MSTTTTTTTAEKVARKLGNDGMRWRTKGGSVQLGTLCEKAGATRTWWNEGGSDGARYEFADGSSIVTAGDGWDIGLPGRGCHCWAGADHGRHSRECDDEWSDQDEAADVASEVSLRRPDLAAGDAIAVVLMGDPTLTADEVIEILDEAAADRAADLAADR